jgi:hypothetical protein
MGLAGQHRTQQADQHGNTGSQKSPLSTMVEGWQSEGEESQCHWFDE